MGDVYLSVIVYLKDGGQVNRVVGPFASLGESSNWAKDLGQAQLRSRSKKLSHISIVLLQEIPQKSQFPQLSAAKFLEEVLGSYQDQLHLWTLRRHAFPN